MDRQDGDCTSVLVLVEVGGRFLLLLVRLVIRAERGPVARSFWESDRTTIVCWARRLIQGAGLQVIVPGVPLATGEGLVLGCCVETEHTEEEDVREAHAQSIKNVSMGDGGGGVVMRGGVILFFFLF